MRALSPLDELSRTSPPVEPVSEENGRLKILLVGTRILPFRHAGDKNFWLDILQRLLAQGHEVRALSVMADELPASDLPIRRVESIPVYLRPDGRFNRDYRILGGTNNYASKTSSLPRVFREIRRVRSEFRPDVIHFADNYGPGMMALRAAIRDLPLTISAPTYYRNIRLYDLFLLASFSSFNVVVPFSEAYRQRLLDLGVAPERIQRIRWGVDIERFVPPSPTEKSAARLKLGLDGAEFVVLWTGFLQQMHEEDLRSAVRIAQFALEHGPPGLVFLFCLKPEHYHEWMRAFERPRLRVFGTSEMFHAAVTAADLLLSPLGDSRSTAAPPLAWLECLARGIPILTTGVPGTQEAVMPGVSGFIVDSERDAERRLLEIADDPALHGRLRAGARQVVVERYSSERVCREYVELWSRLARAPKRFLTTKAAPVSWPQATRPRAAAPEVPTPPVTATDPVSMAGALGEPSLRRPPPPPP